MYVGDELHSTVTMGPAVPEPPAVESVADPTSEIASDLELREVIVS